MRHAACVAIAIALACGCNGSGSEKRGAAPSTQTLRHIELTATVRSIDYLTRIKESALVVGADPRFALALDIREAKPQDDTFKAGKPILVAIHSPTRLFGHLPLDDFQRDPVGKTFGFSVDLVQLDLPDGKPRSYWSAFTCTTQEP